MILQIAKNNVYSQKASSYFPHKQVLECARTTGPVKDDVKPYLGVPES